MCTNISLTIRLRRLTQGQKIIWPAIGSFGSSALNTTVLHSSTQFQCKSPICPSLCLSLTLTQFLMPVGWLLFEEPSNPLSPWGLIKSNRAERPALGVSVIFKGHGQTKIDWSFSFHVVLLYTCSYCYLKPSRFTLSYLTSIHILHYTHYNTKYCILYSSTFVNVANVNLCYGDPAVVMKM